LDIAVWQILCQVEMYKKVSKIIHVEYFFIHNLVIFHLCLQDFYINLLEFPKGLIRGLLVDAGNKSTVGNSNLLLGTMKSFFYAKLRHGVGSRNLYVNLQRF